MEPNRRFMSLRIKMLLIVVLRITIFFTVVVLWVYNFLSAVSAHSLQADVDKVLLAGPTALSGDTLAGLVAAPPTDLADPRLTPLKDWFTQAALFGPRAHPYIYYESAPGQFNVLVDGLELQNPSAAEAYQPGQALAAVPGGLLPAGLQKQTFNLNPHQARGETVVSGVTPLRDAKGQVVAALAVDVPPDTVSGILLQARTANLLMMGLVYLLVSVSVWFITGNLTHNLRSLNQASERIGEGDYTPITLKSGRFDDEVSHLARTLNQMIEKIHGREETLRKQVEKLTIQIDETRRKQAVDEVTDSDFFRDLRTKANDMRQHHSGETDQA